MLVSTYVAAHDVIRPGRCRYQIFEHSGQQVGKCFFASSGEELEREWLRYCLEQGYDSSGVYKIVCA